MAIRCPKCRMPSYATAETGEPGRLIRCSYCDTTWLARHFRRDLDPAGATVQPQPRQRPPLIIEGEVARNVRFAAAAARPGVNAAFTTRPSLAGRYGLALGTTALVLMLIAVVLLTPAVSALPRLAFGADGEFRLSGVTSRAITLRGAPAILVEGEIVNRTGRTASVPAVRLALTDNGSEVYSWLIEPTVSHVDAGQSVGFRSAVASPRPGASHVAATLAEATRRHQGGG